jgi:drug/metabolite transporter (DMT)-like permease
VPAGLALGTAAAACWGLGPVATKAALAGFSPEILGVTRLTGAALCFRLLGGSGTRWLPGDAWSAFAGIALGVDFLLYNYGLRVTTAAVAGLLVNFGQVSNIILAWLLLGEQLTARRISGAALTLAGIGVVNSVGGDLDTGRLGGNVLVMLASVAWSIYAVAQRRAPRAGNVFQLLAPIFVVAALVSMLALLASGAGRNPLGREPAVMLAVLVGACTIAPYLFYGHGQEMLDVIVLTIVLASAPVFAVAFSWLILDEPISWRVVAGGSVILAGILIVAIERR